MAAVSFIVLRHQYGRRDVMFKYLAPARERDFKYLLFDTPLPPNKARFKPQSLLQKGIYIASHGSTRARYHPAKPEVLNHYLYLFFLQDGKLVEEFFGLDCLHFSAQGHAAAALALWRSMVWYYLKTTPMLFSVYAFLFLYFLLQRQKFYK